MCYLLRTNQRWQLEGQFLSEPSYFLLSLAEKNHLSFKSLAFLCFFIFYSMTNTVILIKLYLFREVIVNE